MDPRQLFADERHKAFCPYCGDRPTTTDHVPPKVFLDEPFPANLPVVRSCQTCNEVASLDEEYLACIIDCVLSDPKRPEDVPRQKVARILRRKPELFERMHKSRRVTPEGEIVWDVEHERVREVVVKLARGHISYELSSPELNPSTVVGYAPLLALTDDERESFETVTASPVYPEIGSRAFIRLFRPVGNGLGWGHGWRIVQEGRYRYMVDLAGQDVRIVLSEYLACWVVWDNPRVRNVPVEPA